MKQEMQTTHRLNTGTETITAGEGTKGSDIYRDSNQGGDGVQVSDDAQVCITMVTCVCHNEQPGDLEAGERAHMTNKLIKEHDHYTGAPCAGDNKRQL